MPLRKIAAFRGSKTRSGSHHRDSSARACSVVIVPVLSRISVSPRPPPVICWTFSSSVIRGSRSATRSSIESEGSRYLGASAELDGEDLDFSWAVTGVALNDAYNHARLNREQSSRARFLAVMWIAGAAVSFRVFCAPIVLLREERKKSFVLPESRASASSSRAQHSKFACLASKFCIVLARRQALLRYSRTSVP